MIIAPAVTVPESAKDDGRALHAALLAEARAVVSGVMTVDRRTAEDVAAVVHRAAGDDVSEETLSVLADILTAG